MTNTTHNTTYTEEELMSLMMDALDGTLSVPDQHVLTTQLVHYPALAQEWQAMQQVEALLIATPMAAPPPHFAAQTIACLPNLALRRTLSAALFTVLFIGGLLPFLLAVGAGLMLVGGGTAVSSFIDLLANFGQFSALLMSALGNLLLGMGTYMGAYPAVLGTFMVMIGSIFLWSGVYRQLVAIPQVASQ